MTRTTFVKGFPKEASRELLNDSKKDSRQSMLSIVQWALKALVVITVMTWAMFVILEG